MKAFTLVFVIGFCQAAIRDDWISFKKNHGKHYDNPLEEHYRMKVFEENKKMIEEHNQNYEKGLVSFHMKMNHFGDLTKKEFEGLMNKFMKPANRSGSTFVAPENVVVPESIDWRSKGAVTPVKDQGGCASCWAFSTTGALEGQNFRKNGKLVSLSEQQLVDCSKVNNGCRGGYMDDAFAYIKDAGGLDTEESYPYEGKDNTCRFKKTNVAATDSGFVDLPSGDEEALKKAIATVGPISVGIDAIQDSFMFYSGGIYDDKNCSSVHLNHGVLVVGYGTENGQDYWLVKNSWNTKWGEAGYVKIARNKENRCGVATNASYPLV